MYVVHMYTCKQALIHINILNLLEVCVRVRVCVPVCVIPVNPAALKRQSQELQAVWVCAVKKGAGDEACFVFYATEQISSLTSFSFNFWF